MVALNPPDSIYNNTSSSSQQRAAITGLLDRDCFNWAPQHIISYVPPYTSHLKWITNSSIWLMVFYLLVDSFDSLGHVHDWDTSRPDPVPSLPFPPQLAYFLSIAFSTYPTSSFLPLSGLLCQVSSVRTLPFGRPCSSVHFLSKQWPGAASSTDQAEQPFLEPTILKFFLLQPVGLLIE